MCGPPSGTPAEPKEASDKPQLGGDIPQCGRGGVCAPAAAAAPYANIATLITLPNPTCEGRQCHALRIVAQGGANRVGVYFLGGVHSREWGSCDILINFIEQIEQAYVNGTALTFGSKTFSAADIKTIVDTLDILVFPQANPDGRYYSMNVELRLAQKSWSRRQRASHNVPASISIEITISYGIFTNTTVRHQRIGRRQILVTIITTAKPLSPNRKPKTLAGSSNKFANTRFFIDVHTSRTNGSCTDGATTRSERRSPHEFHERHLRRRSRCRWPLQGVHTRQRSCYIVISCHGLARRNQGREGHRLHRRAGLQPLSHAGTSEDYFYSRHVTDVSQTKIITLHWSGAPYFNRLTQRCSTSSTRRPRVSLRSAWRSSNRIKPARFEFRARRSCAGPGVQSIISFLPPPGEARLRRRGISRNQ